MQGSSKDGDQYDCTVHISMKMALPGTEEYCLILRFKTLGNYLILFTLKGSISEKLTHGTIKLMNSRKNIGIIL